MRGLRRYLRWRILRRHPIADGLWFDVTRRIRLLHRLAARDRAQLRELATLFLHTRDFSGAQGLVVDDEIRLVVAAQACLPILALGLDAYAGWREIILYPQAFRVARSAPDEDGIVHQENDTLSGESWSRGPVILSWADTRRDSFAPRPGHNVVIHEFAHKLDMLNGRANGMPPLHPQMAIAAWTAALGNAYEHLRSELANHRRTPIDSYAATNPAEFFAVLCEYFFTDPHTLRHYCPPVYGQLREYFRLDPGGWVDHAAGRSAPAGGAR